MAPPSPPPFNAPLKELGTGVSLKSQDVWAERPACVVVLRRPG